MEIYVALNNDHVVVYAGTDEEMAMRMAGRPGVQVWLNDRRIGTYLHHFNGWRLVDWP